MANQVRSQVSLSAYLFLVCYIWITVYTSIAVNGMPQDKSFQSEIGNDVIDATSDQLSKLPPFSSRSVLQENSANDAVDPIQNRELLNNLVSLLGHKKLPPNWFLHRALGQHKRQIHYQQCYFNPISCF